MGVTEQLKEYISKIFGPMVGEKLLMVNLKKLGVRNLDSMDLKQQSDVMENVLRNIFQKHLQGKNLDAILTETKINFSLDNATPNIAKLINQSEMKIKPLKPEKKSKEDIPGLLEPFNKDITLVVPVTLHGDFNAIAVVFLDKVVCLDIANEITKMMTGKDAASRDLDDVTKNSIKEFLNITISECLKLYNTITTKNINFVLDMNNIDKYDSYSLEIQENIQKDESIENINFIDLEIKLKMTSLKGKILLIS
jgi:chemotaxis protein CheY-P-specific phosphatase CheC